MNEWDIKHPLRGPEYDNIPVLKQEFKDHILGLVTNPDSFFNYKKDCRRTMKFSKLNSDEYIREEQA